VLHVALVEFLLQITLYFRAESPVNLLYLAISHSGVNDVSPLHHLFHRAWSTKSLISDVPGYVHVLRLELAIILNICYTPLLISSWCNRLLELLTDYSQISEEDYRIVDFLWLMFSQVV